MKRCLFGHVLVDENGKCERCFGHDYGEGVKGVSLANAPTIPLVNPLTPIHHAKKNIGKVKVRYY